MKELNIIQTRLVAGKNSTNDFGHYKYRSLETIMECLKPLLKETECTITFNDDLVCVEGRIFVKSTATLKNKEGETETSTSFAELDNHKGMSKEQSTGSSSSYARKYAACSLLAIDDNADPDSMDNTDKSFQGTTKKDSKDCKQVLIDFCGKHKPIIKEKYGDFAVLDLQAFYRFYEQKMENWNGDFDVTKLFKNWCAKSHNAQINEYGRTVA